MMRVTVISFLLLASQLAQAASEHHSESPVIPTSSLLVQAFNFTVLFVLLFVLLKKTVKAHFANRAAEYKSMVERADNARQQAQKEHDLIKERLQNLEATTAQSIEQAKKEAAELREKMVEEAKLLADKLDQEAKRTAGVEVEKAKAELRTMLLEQALEASRTSLKNSLGSSEQKKLNSEFVDKIQVVRG